MPADPGEALPAPRKAYTHSIKKRLLVRQVEREAFRSEIVPFLLATINDMPAHWRGALRVVEMRSQGVSSDKIREKSAQRGDPVPATETALHLAASEARSLIQAAFIQRFGVVPYYQLRWAGRW